MSSPLTALTHARIQHFSEDLIDSWLRNRVVVDELDAAAEFVAGSDSLRFGNNRHGRGRHDPGEQRTLGRESLNNVMLAL